MYELGGAPVRVIAIEMMKRAEMPLHFLEQVIKLKREIAWDLLPLEASLLPAANIVKGDGDDVRRDISGKVACQRLDDRQGCDGTCPELVGKLCRTLQKAEVKLYGMAAKWPARRAMVKIGRASCRERV